MHDDEFIVTVTHSSVTTIYFSEIWLLRKLK
jgi:hypothetical protein